MKVPMRATSDLHLTEHSAPYVFAALRELRADAQAHGGPTFIVGDILEQPRMVHMQTYNELRQMLWFWPDTVYVIPGNHDQFGDTWENALIALSSGQVRVVSQPIWGRYGRILPYTKPDRFADELAGITNAPVGDTFMLPIVWCHHGFKGAYRNAMSRDRDGVSCAAIPPNHLVVTGHYHMPQTLGRIIYCGSPYQTSFAEEGQLKGWLKWDDALEDPIPRRIAYSDLGAPRHFTIWWDPSKGKPEVPPGIQPHDIVRVKTLAQRQEALKHAKQLTSVGLGGAPIVAQLNRANTVRLTATNPRAAAEQWVLFTLDGSPADPMDMHEFADREGLWDS